MSHKPADLVQFAAEVAREAGALLMKHFETTVQVRKKGFGADIVTTADIEAEIHIIAALRFRFPDHGIIGEEVTTSKLAEFDLDEGLEVDDSWFVARARYDDPDLPEYIWIIDPLDGTVNFSHGLPIFSVSIACYRRRDLLEAELEEMELARQIAEAEAENGTEADEEAIEAEAEEEKIVSSWWDELGSHLVPVAGVIYLPPQDQLYTTSLGGGSWVDGERLHVSEVGDLKGAVIATGFPYDKWTEKVDNLANVKRVVKKSQGLRRLGSAAIDLANVAAGNMDAFWELKLAPWDTAAGALLVAEAGGRMTALKGEPFDPFKPELVASNGRIHDELLKLLKWEK
jgi:myo-inositol-1(or 4)-monophosphatase